MSHNGLKLGIKFFKKSTKHVFLVIGILMALTSRGKSWETPNDVMSVSVEGAIGEVDTAVMCGAFKDGLLKNGLVIGFHVSLPRDDSDYLLFSTSIEDDGMFVSVNEDRQLIIYFGKASVGYEISMPDPEFISDIRNRSFDSDGNVIIDQLNTTLFLTRFGFSNENIAIEAYTGSPFLSTVVKVVPLASVSNARCSGTGNLGVGIANSTAAIDVAQTGITAKALLLRSIFIQRSTASLFVVAWLVSLWFTRKSDYAGQANRV